MVAGKSLTYIFIEGHYTVVVKANLLQGSCDWESKGVSIFDMSNITWGSVYDANAAPYLVPNQIVGKIGGRYV